MQDIIEKFSSDSTFMWFVIILAGLLILLMIKKLFKLILILLAVSVIYVAYLYYTGEDPIENVNELLDEAKELIP